MKVLVVDDDWAVADVISFSIRRAGYEVFVAHDGQQALEYWQSETPDLVILDLNLPKISGFDVLKHIRSIDFTPIIILSVRDSQEDIDKCRKAGSDGYFIKPFSPRQLLARVQAILSQDGGEEHLRTDKYLTNRNCVSTQHE